MDKEGANVLPWPSYRPYFYLDKINVFDTTVRVRCLLCYPATKMLSTSRSSASNLLRHMRKLHPNSLPKSKILGPGYKKSIPVRRKSSEQNSFALSLLEGCDAESSILNDSLTLSSPTKQLKSEVDFSDAFTAQHRVDQLIVNYVVNGLHSPSVVDRPEFRSLINGLQPGRKILEKVTLENIISENANSFRRQLKDILSEVSYVCTTADCWKAYNKCYLGVTVHWIEPSTLERRSAVLACRRIFAPTYLEIARVLEEVNEEFGIVNKIVQVTTDNGINFAKACRVFQIDGNDEEETESSELDYEFVKITPILDTETEEDTLYNVPPHECCAAHLMYLIATTDAAKGEDDALYRDTMREAMSRCQILWKVQNSSLQHSELVKEKLGHLIKEPKDSQWCSQYKALKHLRQLLCDKMDEINSICDCFDLPKFRDVDKIFVDEYCKVMKPVAAALEALQTESNAYLGILLPILHALTRRLVHFRDQASNQDLLVVCYPLLESLIEALDKRFSSHIFRRDLVLASVLHPEFQLNWLKDAEKEAIATECLKEAVREISLTESSPEVLQEDEDDELFDFKKPSVSGRGDIVWQAEVEQYLSFSTGQIKCLNSYSLIKELFIQYNTAIPASAAVEQTFTVLGDIFTQKNGVFLDGPFEDLLLVKMGIK